MGNRGFFWIILIALLLWLFLGSWYFKSNLCGLGAGAAAATSAVAAPAAAAATAYKASYSAIDGSALRATTNQHFRFPVSSDKYATPLGNQLKAEVDKTAAHLVKNKNKSLTITGEYRDSEKNNTPMPNLGLGRANTLKQLFVSKGVGAKQITLASKKVGDNHYKNNFLLGGATYAFGNLATGNSDRLAKIKARLLGKPMIVNFDTNAQSVNLTQQQKVDFSDMMYYLEQVNGSKLEIGGHTDNVGDSGSNQRLSRKRAEFVQGYLKSNGIANRQMSSNGFGPNKPIADNGTAAGKAKNRRVEVILK